jgi:hypothetical protein
MIDPGFVDMPIMLRQTFSDMMMDVHTMLPGKIDSFDPVKQRAKVIIGPAAETLDGAALPYPALINVPVQFMRFGGYALTMPVNPGDQVAIFFSERSMATWLKLSQVGQVPETARFFDIADAFAVPGIFTDSNPIPSFSTSAMELKSEDGSVKIKMTAGGSVEITSGTLITTLLPSGQVRFQNGALELNAITQAMLNLLVPSVTAPNLSSYNTLLGQRAGFV